MSKLFDVQTQLTFYGAYHSNRINVLIHIVCVPMILCLSDFFARRQFLNASIHYVINDYLVFDLNASSIAAALYLAYYYALEPVAALLYTPQMVLGLLSAIAYARSPAHMTNAIILHGICWVAQFLGHGLAEKRSPALLDNLLGAVVLAPFFVHLELLFGLGYRPEMHKRLTNEIGKEITKLRKAQADARRAKTN
ncbi:putative endoplasmic reticulum membrane protein C16E8.02 [Mycena indigotica]|uniref:Putative endoplasmic reticulum membrane protein C16E8.02 n=1 Tax=Mycena indigotica TaxID=2126181 RepID=A0A8H6SMG6_9AGAR|nr:putative endoplasmic reticulum membrane protein C16E8.02 [Mycena indigotica]KAF7301522.1 putative endoplasmic reticulum membrane protein C16E8.02 [Mycena indigotica]